MYKFIFFLFFFFLHVFNLVCKYDDEKDDLLGTRILKIELLYLIISELNVSLHYIFNNYVWQVECVGGGGGGNQLYDVLELKSETC